MLTKRSTGAARKASKRPLRLRLRQEIKGLLHRKRRLTVSVSLEITRDPTSQTTTAPKHYFGIASATADQCPTRYRTTRSPTICAASKAGIYAE